ncbi:MAG: M48 family metallopeptidase [Deltaproteobacteria bacterium]|nr:M48 family metallopeptidase [Deltaproteobacteria bacterium]
MDFEATYFDGIRPVGQPVRLRLDREGQAWKEQEGATPPEKTVRVEMTDGQILHEDLAQWERFTHFDPGNHPPLEIVTRQGYPQRRLVFALLPPGSWLRETGLLGAGTLDGAGTSPRRLWNRLARLPAKPKALAGVTALLAAMTALVVFVVLPGLTPWIARVIPLEFEESLGRQAKQSFTEAFDFSEIQLSADQKSALGKVESRLSRYVGNGYTIHVVPVSGGMVNAITLPGGYILVFDEMWEKLETPDQLAALLGHELGHVAHRDGLQALIHSSALGGLGVALFGNNSALSGSVTAWGQSLLSLRYTRDQETRADDYGLKMMAGLGLNQQAAVDLMTMLIKESPGADALPEFLSSHPDTRQRIELLKQKIPSDAAPGSHFLNRREWRQLKKIPGAKSQRNGPGVGYMT